MENKIAPEFALGTIILIAFALGGLLVISESERMSSPGAPLKKATVAQSEPPASADAPWSNYSNEAQDFSFQYPPGWYVIEDTCETRETLQANSCRVSAASYPYKAGSGDPVAVNPGAPDGLITTITVFENLQKMNPEEYVYSPKGLNHDKEDYRDSIENIGENEFLKQESRFSQERTELPSYYKGSGDKVIWLSGFIFAKDYGYAQMSPEELNGYKEAFKKVVESLKTN